MRLILTTDDDRLARAFAKVAPCYVVFDVYEWRVYLYEPHKAFWLLHYLHDYVSRMLEKKMNGEDVCFDGVVTFPDRPHVREYLMYLAYRLSMHQMVYSVNDGKVGLFVTTRIDYESEQFWKVFLGDVVSVMGENFHWCVE